MSKWWRRGELNPRPKLRHPGLYARVPSFNLAACNADGQAFHAASSHEFTSTHARLPGMRQDLQVHASPLSRRRRFRVTALN